MLAEKYQEVVNFAYSKPFDSKFQEDIFFDLETRSMMMAFHLIQHFRSGDTCIIAKEAMIDMIIYQAQIFESEDSQDRSYQDFMLPHATEFLSRGLENHKKIIGCRGNGLDTLDVNIKFAKVTIEILKTENIDQLRHIFLNYPEILTTLIHFRSQYTPKFRNGNPLDKILETLKSK
jgi:hypothetical protein